MATREDLVNCLHGIIVQGDKDHRSQLALGREVLVPLSGVLAEVQPTHPELLALFEEVRSSTVLSGLSMRIGWSGDRDTGEQVIVLSLPRI